MSFEAVGEKAKIHTRLVEQVEKGMVSPSTGALKAIAKAWKRLALNIIHQSIFSRRQGSRSGNGVISEIPTAFVSNLSSNQNNWQANIDPYFSEH